MSANQNLIEALEDRRLLTASVDGSRHLVVDGTTGNDVIRITLSGVDIRVKIDTQSYNKSFSPADFDSILVTADDGNDVVTMEDAVTKPADIHGNTGNDSLRGGGGVDTIDGGNGDDTLAGGAGGDFLFGNTGSDTADYSDRTASLSITLDNDHNDGAAGELDNVDQSCDTILSGSGNDLIVNSLDINNRAFFGRGGDDTLLGGDGADRLNSGPGDDSLDGGDGPDVLLSTGGSDIMIGGGGDDTVTYYHTGKAVKITIDGIANDGTFGENANVADDIEVIIGGNGNDTLVGSNNPEFLLGANGNDSLLGMGGNDHLFGSGGSDFIDGGAGNDTVFAGSGHDTLVGGAHRDQLYGEAGNDSFRAADNAIDTLDGGEGAVYSGTTDPSLDIIIDLA